MFVNFSPADYNCDETITSLNYATRVKKITNNASKQAESEEVTRLKAMIKRLQGGGPAALDEVDGEEAVAGGAAGGGGGGGGAGDVLMGEEDPPADG